MKFLGFSVAAASLAACDAPVKKAIPYVSKPEEITLGIPNYYASSYYDGTDYCSVLVKTREGRPIKIEGNDLSSITKGATNARVQGSVLSLYDSARLAHPLKGGQKSDWKTVDADITAKLSAASAALYSDSGSTFSSAEYTISRSNAVVRLPCCLAISSTSR